MSLLKSVGLLLLLSCVCAGRAFQSEYGPEVKSFLKLLRQEEEELDFQLKNKEISRREYMLSRNRIAVLRRAVLDEVKRTGQDRIPDYYVVTPSEVEQLIPDGVNSLKGIKPGDFVDKKWRYVGKAFRGEQFLIFERIQKQ
jgi:hypothetical protein